MNLSTYLLELELQMLWEIVKINSQLEVYVNIIKINLVIYLLETKEYFPFQLSTKTAPTPTICGSNAGQHSKFDYINRKHFKVLQTLPFSL